TRQKDSAEPLPSKVDAKLASSSARNKSKERSTVADKQQQQQPPVSGTTASTVRSSKEQKDRAKDDGTPPVPVNAEKATKLSKDAKQKRDTQPEIFAYVPQRQAAKKAAEHIKSGLGKPSGADQTPTAVVSDEKVSLQAATAVPPPSKAGSKIAGKGKDDRKSTATGGGSSSSGSSSSSGGSSSSSCSSSSSSGSESEDDEEEEQVEATSPTLGKKAATPANRARAVPPTAKGKQQRSTATAARQDVLPFLDKGTARSVSESSSSSSSSSSSGSSSDSDSDTSSSNQSSADEATEEPPVVPAAAAATGRNRRKSVSVAASVKQQDSVSPKKPSVPSNAAIGRKGTTGRKPSTTTTATSSNSDEVDDTKEQHSTPGSKPASGAGVGKGKEATAVRGSGKESKQQPPAKSNADDESSRLSASNVPAGGGEKPLGNRRNSYQPPALLAVANETTPLKRGGRRQSVFVGASDIEEKQRKSSIVAADVPSGRNAGRRKVSEMVEAEKPDAKKAEPSEVTISSETTAPASEDTITAKRPISGSPVARKRRSPKMASSETDPTVSAAEAKERMKESETELKASQTTVDSKCLVGSGSDAISLLTDEDSADQRKAKEKLPSATATSSPVDTSSDVVMKAEESKVEPTSKSVEIISLVDDSRSNDDVVVIEDASNEAKVEQKPPEELDAASSSCLDRAALESEAETKTPNLFDAKPSVESVSMLKDSHPSALDVKEDESSGKPSVSAAVEQVPSLPSAIVEQPSFDSSTSSLQLNNNSGTAFGGDTTSSSICDASGFGPANNTAAKDDGTGAGAGGGLLTNSDTGTPSIFDLLLPQDSSVTDDTFELNQSLNFPFMEDCKEDTQRETLNLVEKLRQKYKKSHGTANSNATPIIPGSDPLKSLADVGLQGGKKDNDMMMLDGGAVVTAQTTQSPLLVPDFVAERPPKQDGSAGGLPLGSATTFADALLGGKDKLQPELEYGAFNKFHSATSDQSPLGQLPPSMQQPGGMQPVAVQQPTQQQPQPTNQLQPIGQQSQPQLGNKSAKEDRLDHLASRPSDERWVPPSSIAPAVSTTAPSMLHPHAPLPTSVGSSVLGGNTVSTAQLAQNCMEAARMLNSHQTNNNNNVNALDSEKTTHGAAAGPATGGGLFDGGALTNHLHPTMQQQPLGGSNDLNHHHHHQQQQQQQQQQHHHMHNSLPGLDFMQGMKVPNQNEATSMMLFDNLQQQQQQRQQQQHQSPQPPVVGRRGGWNQPNDGLSSIDQQQQQKKQHECAVMQEKENLLLQKQQQQQQQHRKLNDLNSFMDIQNTPNSGQPINNSSSTGTSNSVNAMQQQQQQQPYGFASSDTHPAHHQQQQQQQQHYPGAVSLFPPASVPVPFPSPGAGLYPPNFGNAGYQQPTPPQTTVPNAGKPHQHQHHAAPGSGLGSGVPPMTHHGMGLSGEAMVSPHRGAQTQTGGPQQQKQMDQMSSPLGGMAVSPNKQQSRQPTPTEQQNNYLLNSGGGGNGGTSSGGSTPRTPQHRRTPQRHNHQLQQPDVVGMDMLVGVGHSNAKKSPTKSSRSSSRIQNQQQQQQQQPPPHLQQHHPAHHHHHHHPLLMSDSNGGGAGSALAGMVHPMGGHQLKSPPSLTAPGTKSLSPGKSPKTAAAAVSAASSVYELQKAIGGSNSLVPPSLSSTGKGGPKGETTATGKPGRGRGRGRGRPPG
uniref:Uncharacterized protein n=1 Tax=Anopheles maculatus TaxID=74869 RepID=A0A182SYW8_9DIPT